MNHSEYDVPTRDPTLYESDSVSHLPAKRRRSRGADTLLAKTDRELKNALLRLLERKQFDHISIREICAEAHIHYATFFRRHQTKEELLDRVAADQIERMMQLTLPILDTHEGFIALLKYVDEHRSLWTTLLTGGASATMRATMISLATRVSAEAVVGESKVPRSLARAATVTVIIESITWWLSQPQGRYTAAAMADYVEELLQSCLIPPLERPSRIPE